MDIPELDNDKIEEGQFFNGTVKGEYCITENNGFTYVNVNDKKYLILYYETLICILIDCSNNDAFFGLNKTSKYVNADRPLNTYVGIIGNSEFYLKTSSYLIEKLGGKEVKYDGRTGRYYYQLTLPWVEGVAGYGIGEWIETKVDRTDEVVFFNGYIDPNRPDLYKANGRVKEIEVSVGNKSWKYTLEDSPHPQILKLPELMNEDVIRFTIRDVYTGERYTDTCIAGIYYLLVPGRRNE
jgi:hypothetical protein